MSKAERKLQEEAIRLGMPVPSAKKTTETPVKPAASVTTTESRAERRARIMAEQKALIAAGTSSEEEESTATEAPKGDFDFAETEEALPTKDDAFLMFLNNNDALAEEAADDTSGAGCDDFFGGNDIISEDVRAYERDSADAAEIIEFRAEVAEELAKESSPAVPEETRVERRARLMAEQRALLDTDSDSEDEVVTPLLTGKATVTPPYTPKPTEPKEEETAAKSEETREERRARILAEQRALMNSDSESESDEEEEEDEESEAESDDEDADDASVAGQTTAVVVTIPAMERTATLESIPEETTPDMAVIDLDEALKSDAESDDESDDESEEIVSKSQAKFIPNERQLSVVSGPSSTLKSASLMIDDDCEDIKYATLSRALHQKRRKAAPKVRAVTAFKSKTSQRRRSVRCAKLGRRRCPGMSKTAPGPGSYNVNYSSFGQKKSFSVRKCTFGSTSIGAAGSRSMHITRSGHVIYKSSARPARKCAGVRTVARPAWSLNQKRRKQTPLKRNLHQATKRSPKVSPRSRKTKSKAKKMTVEVTATAQESATREAARRVEELRAQLAQMKEQSATPVVEEPIVEPQIEAVEEVEEESKAPQRKYVADDDSSCAFEGGDDISDMDSIAALLRANGISGY